MRILLILGIFLPILGWANDTPTALDCLTANIYMEARGESLNGMQAIAAVTLNRVQHPLYPNSICAVVLQRGQFSWTKNKKQVKRVLTGDLRGFKAEDVAAYQKSKLIAADALKGGYKPTLPYYVVSFHNQGVSPTWARTMRKYGTIGRHTFFGFKGGKK